MNDNNLSYPDVAYKVLKDSRAKSLHYRDIARKAFELELIESDDVIIAGNISAAISAEIRKASLNGLECRFIKHDRAFYGLAENEPVGIFAEIRAKNNSVKEQLLKVMLSMHPSRFEELVGEVLRKLNFEKVIVTGKTGDGGIDITGELVVGGVIRNSICVQVKRWRNNVQRSDISQLRGSLRPHQTGLFITTSDFSKPAIDEASDAYKAPISLMNGKELIEFMCEFGIGVSLERVTILELEEENRLIEFQSPPEIDKNKGLEIFASYKGHKHYALFFSETKILYNNEYYKSPSIAGSVITGSQINGWRFWKYVDKKTNKEIPLNNIREK